MLAALILYDSRARGDFHSDSDVDLLGIVPEGRIKGDSAFRGVNMHVLPFEHLLSISSKGDLFASHIVHEGKSLYDSMDTFQRIQSAFKWKANYRREVTTASIIIYYILSTPNVMKRVDLVKRLIWAVRTLIISSAAEERKIVFSAKKIAEFTGNKHFRVLLENRNDPEIVPQLVLMAKEVDNNFGIKGTTISRLDRRQIERHLLQRGGVGASTIALVKGYKNPEQTKEPEVNFYD